jgi:hypothetical protein
VGAGAVVVGAGTVVVGAGGFVVVGAGGSVVVGAGGSVVVGAGSVVAVVGGDVGRVGGVVLVVLVGDVGVGFGATVEVGTAGAGTGGKAADFGVVVVTPGEDELGPTSALVGTAVEAVDGAVEAFAAVVVGSALAADVSEVDVDGASAMPGSIAVGKEVDGGPEPTTSDRTSGAWSPPSDKMIGRPRAATQPKAASNPLYLSTACATRLSRNPSTTPQSLLHRAARKTSRRNFLPACATGYSTRVPSPSTCPAL